MWRCAPTRFPQGRVALCAYAAFPSTRGDVGCEGVQEVGGVEHLPCRSHVVGRETAGEQGFDEGFGLVVRAAGDDLAIARRTAASALRRVKSCLLAS